VVEECEIERAVAIGLQAVALGMKDAIGEERGRVIALVAKCLGERG